MKRIAALVLTVVAAPSAFSQAPAKAGPAQTISVADRCDVSWLAKAAGGDGDIDNKRIAMRAADGKAHLLENSDVCDYRVWGYVLKNSNSRVKPLWDKSSFQQQAKLLLWADQIFKLSDAKAIVVFQKAEAIYNEAAKIHLIDRGDKRSLTEAYGEASGAEIDLPGGGKGMYANDAISAADVTDPKDKAAAAKAGPADISALKDQILGPAASAPAQGSQPAPASKVGPLIKDFNVALLGWINELAPLQATGDKFLYHVIDRRQNPRLSDLMTQPSLPAGGEKADPADGAAMAKVYAYMTDLDLGAAKKWDDRSEGKSFLAQLDKAQRTALAIHLAMIADVIGRVSKLGGGADKLAAPKSLTAPGQTDPTTAAFQQQVAGELGVGSGFDPNAANGQKQGQANLSQDDVRRIMAARGVNVQNGTASGTALDGTQVSVPVQTDGSGAPVAGESARVAQALLAGNGATADATALAAALKPADAPATGADAVAKGAGCDKPGDLFRSDVSRYARKKKDALADDAEASSAKRSQKQKDFDDWAKQRRDDCADRANSDDSLDPAAKKALVDGCEKEIASARDKLSASLQANQDSVTQRRTAGEQERDTNILAYYKREIPKSVTTVKKAYLSNGPTGERRLESLADDAGWSHTKPKYLRPYVEKYFAENWEAPAKASTSIDECAVKGLKPALKDPDAGNVEDRCVRPGLLAYLKAAKGTVKDAPALAGSAFDPTIK